MPEKLPGDKAYSAPRIMDWLKERGVEPVIPYRKDETKRMAEPPDELDQKSYKGRNTVVTPAIECASGDEEDDEA